MWRLPEGKLKISCIVCVLRRIERSTNLSRLSFVYYERTDFELSYLQINRDRKIVAIFCCYKPEVSERYFISTKIHYIPLPHCLLYV